MQLAKSREENGTLTAQIRTLEWDLTAATTQNETLKKENRALNEKVLAMVADKEQGGIIAHQANYGLIQELQQLKTEKMMLEQHMEALKKSGESRSYEKLCAVSFSALAGTGSESQTSMLRQLESMREQTRLEFEGILRNMQLEFDTHVQNLVSVRSGLEMEKQTLERQLTQRTSTVEVPTTALSSALRAHKSPCLDFRRI